MKIKDIFILLLLSSCISSNNMEKDWVLIKAKGISKETNSIFDHLAVQSKNAAVLLGSAYSDSDFLNANMENGDALAYTTVNAGKDWSKSLLGKGRFTAIEMHGHSFYISKLGADRGSTIYVSEESGNNWKVLSIMPEFYIRNILFDSAGDIYIVGKKQNDTFWTLKKRNPKTENWNEIDTLDNGVIQMTISGESLFYLNERV